MRIDAPAGRDQPRCHGTRDGETSVACGRRRSISKPSSGRILAGARQALAKYIEKFGLTPKQFPGPVLEVYGDGGCGIEQPRPPFQGSYRFGQVFWNQQM